MCVDFEKYKTELEEIKLTQNGKKALVRALAEREPEKKTRRPVRPLRMALIAACVCLALVGASFAATGGYGIFTRSNEDGTTTRVYREKLHPFDSLTDETRQHLEESKKSIEEFEQNGEEDDFDPVIQEVMGSWQEIQERTGVDLIDSALLDGAELFNYWTRQCYTVTYYPTKHMSICRMHIIDGVKVSLTASVLMEGYNGMDGDVYSSEYTESGPIYVAGAELDDAVLQVYKEPYALADGTPVYYHTENWPTGEVYISGVFIYDGIEYSIIICDAERDRLSAEGSEIMSAMMDAGEEIDYDKVNAPLNQFQVDPNTDYGGVFFRVMDSFIVD